MVALVAILVWRLPAYLVLPVWLFFGGLDGAFLSSAFEKVPNGAWFTLMLAFILSSAFSLWRFGKEAQWKAESLDQLSPSALFSCGSGTSTGIASSVTLSSTFGGMPVSTVPGLGVFFDKIGDLQNLPPCFAQFITKFAVRPSVVVFFHMRSLPLPTVPANERYVVTRMSRLPGCYNVTLRHGYTENVLNKNMARDLIGQIELAVSQARQTPSVETELQRLRAAYGSQMVYVLGKETMKIGLHRAGIGFPWAFPRYALLYIFLWIRENSRAKLADLALDADRVVEVGFVKEI